jgi:hypothetical protein
MIDRKAADYGGLKPKIKKTLLIHLFINDWNKTIQEYYPTQDLSLQESFLHPRWLVIVSQALLINMKLGL